jgi:hypothetical protein
MSQELVMQNDDGFDVQERSNNYIIGGMIKYFNHVYTLNKAEPLPPDLILLVLGIVTCWVRWWDHAPTEHRVTYSGQMHPRREDLPDLDKTLWQPGLGDNLADPWKDSRYMHLIDLQTGRDYTFVTDTDGGRMAIGELKSSIRNVRMALPGAMALIKFGTTTFKSKRFGLVPRPLFENAGWRKGLKEVSAQISDQSKPQATTKEALDQFAKSADKPAAQTTTAQSELPLIEAKKSLAEELNDSIPDFGEEATKASKPSPSSPRSTARRELSRKASAKAARVPARKRVNPLEAG